MTVVSSELHTPLPAIVLDQPQPAIIQADLVRPQAAWPWRLAAAIGSAWDWLFGIVSLIGGLALLATIPVLQVLSLGYLLEVSGRVARTGRLRDGLIGVRKAGRVGSTVLGVWLFFWPLRLVSSLWTEARLIDADGPVARQWRLILIALSVAIVAHVIGACLRGGRLRSFLIPRPILLVKQLLRRDTYGRVRDAVWDFAASLHLPYYFWLGLRGFFGALLWLLIPVSMLAASSSPQLQTGAGVLLGLVGGGLLMLVLLRLPLLQTAFAAENRFGAMFELRKNRQRFNRAPIACYFAILFTLALALPLYLLKIEVIPREAAWLPSLLFVMSIYPARLLTGWACGRAARREQPRHWFWRLVSRLGLLPVAAIYVVIVYFTQYLSWYGIWSLYEQHAFLLPVPFLGI